MQAGIFDSQASFKPHSATKGEVSGSKAGAGRHLLTDASKIEPEDQSQGWLWPRIPLNLAFDQIFYTHTVSEWLVIKKYGHALVLKATAIYITCASSGSKSIVLAFCSSLALAIIC